MPDGLRDARPSDRPALLDLWVAAWRDVFPAIDFEARRTWLNDHLDRIVTTGGRVVIVEGDGAPAGFVAVDLKSRVLEQLAVDPRRQGRGLASALIVAAKALSPSGLDLIVNRDNAAARRFYRRMDFVEVGTGINPLSGLPTLKLRWTEAR